VELTIALQNIFFYIIFDILCLLSREEIEKQKAHERYMKLQEQGKTEQARKDLGENSICMLACIFLQVIFCCGVVHKIRNTIFACFCRRIVTIQLIL
jgi:hypothetical protein